MKLFKDSSFKKYVWLLYKNSVPNVVGNENCMMDFPVFYPTSTIVNDAFSVKKIRLGDRHDPLLNTRSLAPYALAASFIFSKTRTREFSTVSTYCVFVNDFNINLSFLCIAVGNFPWSNCLYGHSVLTSGWAELRNMACCRVKHIYNSRDLVLVGFIG